MLELLPLHIYVYDNPNEVNQSAWIITTTQVDIEKNIQVGNMVALKGMSLKRYGTVHFMSIIVITVLTCHYTTTISTINQDFPGWKLLPESIYLDIYKDIGDNLIPLYHYCPVKVG